MILGPDRQWPLSPEPDLIWWTLRASTLRLFTPSTPCCAFSPYVHAYARPALCALGSLLCHRTVPHMHPPLTLPPLLMQSPLPSRLRRGLPHGHVHRLHTQQLAAASHRYGQGPDPYHLNADRIALGKQFLALSLVTATSWTRHHRRSRIATTSSFTSAKAGNGSLTSRRTSTIH